ncbi:RDD family protein [Congregibacter sp.]|uniref:RDD family protein n=1 Tax=Congregibacter sp. TaxID=2744308 RepID=UPI00385A0EC9
MTKETLPAPALPRRLAAIVYDAFLVIPLIMVCVAMGLGIRMLLGSAADSLLPATAVQMIAVLSCIGFFGVFWMKNGQTLGMQAWRIKLVPMPGNELSFGRVVTRCLSALLSALCLGLGYWWCLFDKKKRSWHDYLSGTELVLIPKKPKKTSKREPESP